MPKIELIKAFTLLEIIIVIIIIGVLTSLALPKMANVIEGVRASEAIAMIGQIRAGVERCYLMNNGSYADCDAGYSSGWELLGMDNPKDAPGSHFNYYVGGSPYPDAYLVYAIRKTNVGVSGFGGCYYLCMGIGVKVRVAKNGCGASFNWVRDGKIYWDAKTAVSGFLPRPNE